MSKYFEALWSAIFLFDESCCTHRNDKGHEDRLIHTSSKVFYCTKWHYVRIIQCDNGSNFVVVERELANGGDES